MKRFEKAENTEYLKSRYVCEKVEIGVYPVLFGYRIHAGKINNGYYDLDYCCGADQKNVNLMLSLVKTILEKNDLNFRIFPMQNRKPVFTDVDCFMKLIELGGENLEIVEAENVQEIRKEVMSSLFK
jgi:hypothetical protein